MARAAETLPSVNAAAAPFGRQTVRTFTLAIGLPGLLLYVASVALVVMSLAGMAREINRIENARGVTSMHAALDSFLNDLGSAVADQGTSDEAYLNAVVKPDPAWMDANWGAVARMGQGYDTVLVTDPAGQIVFGEDAAGAITGNMAQRYASAPTMLADLARGTAATADARTVSGFAADPGGIVGLAAIRIHRAAPGQADVPRPGRRILWIARHLSPAVLQDMAIHHQTPLAVLATQVDADASSITLADADGSVVGTLSWMPDRPGDVAFNHALLAASIVFAGIGAVLVVGLGVLRRTVLNRVALTAPAPGGQSGGSERSPGPAGGGQDAEPAEDAAAAVNPLAGVSAGDFAIDYQPIFDLRAEVLIGVEALLRWNNPGNPPLLAEDLAPRQRALLLDRIGMIALRRAADEIAPLLGQTLTFPVTPAQLGDAVFAEKVVGTLGATNLPARRLQLCIDASLLPATDVLAEPMRGLRQRGVMLALGGFSLDVRTASYLDAGLVDRVCLAPSLATRLGPAGHAYLQASIDAARAAGLAVTACGVTRREEAAALVRLGCRDLQGDLLAGPLPIGALTQLVLAPARAGDLRKAG